MERLLRTECFLREVGLDRKMPGKPGISSLGVLERHGVGTFLLALPLVPGWHVGHGLDASELEDTAEAVDRALAAGYG